MPRETNDWESCLREARDAEEGYDYERAVELYRRAVELNDSTSTLLELTRFLFEMYAAYDDVVVVLRDRSKALRGSDVLRLRLARSLFLTAERESAAEQYGQLPEASLEADDWHYLGQVRQEQGDVRRAIECYSKAQRVNPANAAYGRSLEEAQALLSDEASGYVERAESLIESDPRAARLILDQMSERGLRHQRASELYALLDARARATELAAALELARAESDPPRRQQRFAAVLQLDPENAEAAAEVARLDAELGAQRSRAAFEAGLELVVSGDVSGAIDSYLKALVIPGHREFLREWDPEVDPLWSLLSKAMEHFGATEVERSKGSLERLFRVAEAVEYGREASAADLERIGRDLRGFPPYEALNAKLARSERERREREANRLLDDARRLGAAGSYRDALDKLDVAVKRWGGDFGDCAELRDSWRQARERDERRATVLQLVRDRVESCSWFQARRLLATRAGEFLGEAPFAELAERTRGAIDEQFRIRAQGGGAAGVRGALDLERLELGPGPIRLCCASSYALIARGRRLVRVTLPDLRIDADFLLPDDAAPIQGSTPVVLVPDGDAALVARLDQQARSLDVLRLEGARAEWLDQVDLAAELPSGRFYLFVAPALDEPAVTVLTTTNDRRRPSRLFSIGLLDGRIQALDDYAFGLYHLSAIANDSRYLVNRFFDLQRGLTPGFFNLAALDARGRVVEKYFFEDVYDDVATIEWAARHPENGWLHLNYRSVNPLTGEVLPEAFGYMVIRDDRSLFYQSSKPDHLVGTKRRITAPFALTPDGARLLVPYREEGAAGVQLLHPSDFSKAEDLSLESGGVPRAIEIPPSGSCALVVISDDDERTSIRTIDLAERRWVAN